MCALRIVPGTQKSSINVLVFDDLTISCKLFHGNEYPVGF